MGRLGQFVVGIAFVAVCGLLFYVMLGVYGVLADVQEDDPAFNCHVMGNMVCGDSAPWHGFVNAGRVDPY